MNYVSPEKPVPESIAASLARSEAQIAAEQTVPLGSFGNNCSGSPPVSGGKSGSGCGIRFDYLRTRP